MGVMDKAKEIVKFLEESVGEVPYTDSNGERKMSNTILFRDANEDEKVGIQGFTAVDKDGNRRRMFLIVPQRESVGYGNIRGWGSDKDQNMPLFKKTIEAASDAGRNSTNPGAKAISEGSVGILAPAAAAGDLLLGNTIMNNITKNQNSKYTGDSKAVGFGTQGQSAGQILGMVDDTGEVVNAKEAKYFLQHLEKNGFKSIEDIETPTMKQEHTGPAYVPGDILLGFLGLQPNRGSVGFTFKSPEEHSEYQEFFTNLRKSRGGK